MGAYFVREPHRELERERSTGGLEAARERPNPRAEAKQDLSCEAGAGAPTRERPTPPLATPRPILEREGAAPTKDRAGCGLDTQHCSRLRCGHGPDCYLGSAERRK